MIGNIKIIAVCMMSVIIESYGLLIILLLKTITGCLYITPAQTFIGRLCLKKASSLCLTLLIII